MTFVADKEQIFCRLNLIEAPKTSADKWTRGSSGDIGGSVGFEPAASVGLDYLTKVQERTAFPHAFGRGDREKL